MQISTIHKRIKDIFRMSDSKSHRLSLTGPVTWFGHGGITHAVCLG